MAEEAENDLRPDRTTHVRTSWHRVMLRADSHLKLNKKDHSYDRLPLTTISLYDKISKNIQLHNLPIKILKLTIDNFHLNTENLIKHI